MELSYNVLLIFLTIDSRKRDLSKTDLENYFFHSPKACFKNHSVTKMEIKLSQEKTRFVTVKTK